MNQYRSLIKQMTLEEKASLMSGADFWHTKSIERLKVPSMMLADGPHGLRKEVDGATMLGFNKSIPATCFPTAATLANSWDKDLLQEVGTYLGIEAAAADVSVLLGPGLNIKRNPLGGRNFEYFSEDPYLSGKLASSMIQGIQSIGVSACPKHFAVNSQEERRMVIDEIVDERTFREIYLEGFRYAVTEGKAKTIMSSYNKINGTYANENRHLLQDILYKEWKYEGVVVTDWGANNDRVSGLIAGNQLEMPSTAGFTDKEIVDAIKQGVLSETLLDERVESLLSLIDATKEALGKGKNFTDEMHHEFAVEAARHSMVLLKNEENILPIKSKTKIAVIGDFAKNPRYQGAGSSLINPTFLENGLDSLQKTDLELVGYVQGYKRLGGTSKRRLRQAVEHAKKAQLILLFMGLDEGTEAEGHDREHMLLKDNQIALLDAIYSVNQNIVIILSGGSPIEMPWENKAKAILHSYLGGQGGGSAIADILTGKTNPSGKLAETYPVRYSDVPSSTYYPGKQMTSEHKEGLFVGYRYYDSAKIDVKYPFGFGLSYTSFEYSNLQTIDPYVSFEIKNTGSRIGEEIAQVYIECLNSRVFRAKKN